MQNRACRYNHPSNRLKEAQASEQIGILSQRSEQHSAQSVFDRDLSSLSSDEAVQRQLLADYLALQNFRMTALAGGTALRRFVAKELRALVLLDVGLPGEDGFALARWLRERSGRVGIIMVTVAGDTSTGWSGSKAVPTTTSPSRSSRASCWPASRAYSGVPSGHRPRGRACASAGVCSTSIGAC